MKWRLLGIALGVEYTDLERIHVRCFSRGEGVNECLMELLQHWTESDTKASWFRLLDALESTPNQALLEKKVRAKVFPGEYPVLNA